MNSRLGAAIKRFLGDPAGERERGEEIPEQMQDFLRLGKMEETVTTGGTDAATPPLSPAPPPLSPVLVHKTMSLGRNHVLNNSYRAACGISVGSTISSERSIRSPGSSVRRRALSPGGARVNSLPDASHLQVVMQIHVSLEAHLNAGFDESAR